MTETFTKTSYE